MEEFEEYLRITFGVKNGTAGSYKNAIIILNNIFKQYNVFNFSGDSITDISDAGEIYSLYEFVKAEEKKMRAGKDSIFKYGDNNRPSYYQKGFCSAAVRSLLNFREATIQKKATECVK